MTISTSVTGSEAAELKGVDPSSIRRAIRDGRLKGRKVGPLYLIERRDLDRWEPLRGPSRAVKT